MYYEKGALKQCLFIRTINLTEQQSRIMKTDKYKLLQISSGKRNITIKSYYKNGVLHLDGAMKDDKNDGVLKEYTEKGYLYHVITFKNGKMNGKYNFIMKTAKNCFKRVALKMVN